jgi:predicted porin
MKKTLIALAAVAATGAAFAQNVTLSGAVAYGYQATETAGVKSKGFGLDTAELKFSASEDLGGGLKMTVSTAFGDPIGRGDALKGEDTTMVLSGGFGTLLMGQIEIGSGIRGLAQAGAPVNNMEGEVLAPASAGTDIVKYTAPSMSGFTFSGNLTEKKGLATGLETANKGSSAYTIGVDYAAGPLKAKLDYTDYNSAQAAGGINNRYRVAAQYDLGVAKIGAGYESQKLVAGGAAQVAGGTGIGNNNKLWMVGVSAPVGAFTVGAVYTKQNNDSVAGSKAGYSVGASYALSKRTSVDANYARWDNTEGGAVKDNKTTILLVHSF